jgi:hypothetical protein
MEGFENEEKRKKSTPNLTVFEKSILRFPELKVVVCPSARVQVVGS